MSRSFAARSSPARAPGRSSRLRLAFPNSSAPARAAATMPPTSEFRTATARISIDYPETAPSFLRITPPTFIWRMPRQPPAHHRLLRRQGRLSTQSNGVRMHVAHRPKCIADTNELPQLTPQQAASWIWTPDGDTWSHAAPFHCEACHRHDYGYRDGRIASPPAHIAFTTSRIGGSAHLLSDVPLMPSEGKDGFVQPLAPPPSI